MGKQVLYSSKSDLWGTPFPFFKKLDEEFNFELDVCAIAENTKCEKYFTPDQDGLQQEWNGICWMNPPYGKTIGAWMKKAYESSLVGATVVCLIPARTDTNWFHDWVVDKAEVRYVRQRITFTGGDYQAPFASLVIVYRPPSHK